MTETKGKSNFVHLHTHSHYSMLDGMGKVPDLVAKAKALGMPALALTDHGVMHGVVEFYEECEKAGVKPIIGLEAYVAPRTLNDKVPRIDANPYHLILLAKDETGYKNLIALTTVAHLDGYYYKPRVDKKLLKKHSAGLIAASACIKGEIVRKALEDIEKGREAMKEYIGIFGKDNFYLEVQKHHKVTDQDPANELIFKLAAEFDLPVIATNDVHYVDSEDAEAQDALICLQTTRMMDETDRLTMMGDDYSLLPAETMESNFPGHPEVLENTLKLAEKCNFQLKLGEIIIPDFPVPEGHNLESYFKQQCYLGVNFRYGSKKIKKDDLPKDRPVNAEDLFVEPDVWERFAYELSVIEKMQYQGYLLIVSDFTNWAKDKKIAVGPGRGSGAGSIILYALKITDLDPLYYHLLFERFLNPERISMPDIDMDFADDRRHEVIEYVSKKYGRDHVAQIITFGTMAARMAVRDVGRVLAMSYTEVDMIAKLIPFGQTLEKAISDVPELKELHRSDSKIKRCLEIAKRLEGVVRHASMHAAGVVVSKDRLVEYCPLQKATKGDISTVTQYSMNPLEHIGLLKFDFLGLANLTIIQNTLRIIRKTKDVEIDLGTLPLDDEKAYKLLSNAFTTGVFQLESDGMKRYLRELKPNVFEDIISMVALYRPGPIESIPDFIEGKHARREITYLHPTLEPILKSTYGVIVTQDQVLQIARDFAGFTYGEADILRKAVGKKIQKLLDEQKHKFIDGAMKAQKINEDLASSVWDFIEPFARYGFNRAHAACYAMISYQTAYLKARYPSEFMAALMTSEQTDLDKLAICIAECERMKVKVLPPSVNESFVDFGVVKESGNIRFGLSAIKNVGAQVAEEIVTDRQKNGNFNNVEELLTRLGPKVINKKSLESLIMAGALDDLGERAELLFNIEKMLGYAQALGQGRNTAQSSLFGTDENAGISKITFEEMKPADKKQRLAWERELLGMYVSEHPLSGIAHMIEPHRSKALSEITSDTENEFVRVSGIITSVQSIVTRNNQKMAFAKIEDLTAGAEVLVFPKILASTAEFWTPDKIVAVEGFVNFKDGSPKILAETIYEIGEQTEILDFKPRAKRKDRGYNGNGNGNGYGKNGNEEIKQTYMAKMENKDKFEVSPKNLFITVPRGSDKSILSELKDILAESPGNSPVTLNIPENGHGFKTMKIKNKVNICPVLEKKLVELVGVENTVIS